MCSTRFSSRCSATSGSSVRAAARVRPGSRATKSSALTRASRAAILAEDGRFARPRGCLHLASAAQMETDGLLRDVSTNWTYHQVASGGALPGRVNASTSCPCSMSNRTRADPTSPDAPVIPMRIDHTSLLIQHNR